MQANMNKGRAASKKVQNVAKLSKRVPTGLICAYDASEAEYEDLEFFWLDMKVDKHATLVLQQEPTLFLFDSDSGLLYGTFQAIAFHGADSSAKINVVSRERCPALEGNELRKAAMELGLALNKFPEILDSTQVSGLMSLFRKKKLPQPPALGQMQFDEPRLYGGETRCYPRPGFTESHQHRWVHEYENLNDVENLAPDCGYSSRQFDGAPVHRPSNILEPVIPMSFPPAPPSLECSRIINTGMKPVLEQFGGSFTQPARNADAGNGFGYPHSRYHGRASAAAPLTSYNNSDVPFSCSSEGVYQQQVPPSEMIPRNFEFRQPAGSGSPEAGFKHLFRRARKVRELLEDPVVDSTPIPAAGAKKKASASPPIGITRVQGSPRIRRVQGAETKLYTKSFVKRNVSLQQDFEQGGGKLSGKKASVFSRVNRPHKRDSVFNRLDESLGVSEPQQRPEQSHQQQQMPQGRKVSIVRDDNNKLIAIDPTRPRNKTNLRVEKRVFPEPPAGEPEQPEPENSFIDFKRRSSALASNQNKPGSLSPGAAGYDTNHNAKKRRFIRPDGLGSSPSAVAIPGLRAEDGAGVQLVA